jgi:hypothetical protein
MKDGRSPLSPDHSSAELSSLDDQALLARARQSQQDAEHAIEEWDDFVHGHVRYTPYAA